MAGLTKSCGCVLVKFNLDRPPEQRQRAAAASAATRRSNQERHIRPGFFRLPISDAADIVGVGVTELTDKFLRPGIIRSKLYKTVGLRVSAADVSAYMAALQTETKECHLLTD